MIDPLELNPKYYLTRERSDKYARLQQRIGNTPLQLAAFFTSNGNQIFLKEEWQNPTASHYDRVFFHLIRHLERLEQISPKSSILWDVSTGNGALALAWICKELGYKCVVRVPENIPGATLREIEKMGTEYRKTPAQMYVEGLSDKIIPFLREVNQIGENHNPRLKSHALQHVKQDASCKATEEIGEEIIDFFDDAKAQMPKRPHWFIAAAGNGLSLYCPGRVLKEKWPDLKIVAFEPVESPTALEAWKPRTFKRAFQERVGHPFDGFKPHCLRGTGGKIRDNANTIEKFPFLQKAIEETDFLHDIKLVAKSRVEDLVDDYENCAIVGPTSLAGLRVALDIIEGRNAEGLHCNPPVSNEVFVVLQYDPGSKYSLDHEWKYTDGLTPFSISDHQHKININLSNSKQDVHRTPNNRRTQASRDIKNVRGSV